jgi:hypothetical protein
VDLNTYLGGYFGADSDFLGGAFFFVTDGFFLG